MDPKDDWWRTFFTGPPVEWWLRAPLEEATKQEATFLVEALGVGPGSRVLDVPCGGGRHALAMAAWGYVVTGVDISPDFLEVARAMAEERELTIDWVEGEMREIPRPADFDGAYCLGNSFGYLAGEENAEFLRAVAAALRPGARFVLDTGYVAESLFPVLQERSWFPDGEGYCLSARRYNPVEGRLQVAYTFVQDGRAETRTTTARVHTCRELVALLQDAGFTAVETYGSLSRDPFRLGSPRLIAVATKGTMP
jgi:cyclopropane fatty-acyl-phospholipid synthase-like methyltransferase